MFESKLNMDEMVMAWSSSKKAVTNFIRIFKSKNYSEDVSDLLQNYKEMGCDMPLKVHFLDCNLYVFSPKTPMICLRNMENVYFHQNKEIERYYSSENGIQICWLTVAGHSKWMFLKQSTAQNLLLILMFYVMF